MNIPTGLFKKIIFLLLLGCCFLYASPAAEAAAGEKAVITECRLSSKNRVTVKAQLKSPSSVKGSKCYLFAIPTSRSSLKKSDRPLKARTKKGNLTFKVKLNQGADGTLLNYKFLLAEKSGKKYVRISNLRYISNPQKYASYTYKFPKAASKKGLQVASSMQEDAEDLGAAHAVLNIDLAHLIAAKAEHNAASYSFKYKGSTYWLRKSVINQYDSFLKSLSENDTVVSAILLLSYRSDLKRLIYPSGRKKGHSYYALNTKNAAARKELCAVITYLAKRYSGSSHGRIVNWIVGNEVNNYKVYNYAGSLSLKKYAAVYAQAFRLVYQTVTGVYSHARVYISLDHLWNYKVSGAFTSKSMLDATASSLKTHGDIPWNLAYHPYGSPLTEPAFWKNANGQVQNSIQSPVINMLNLSVLTDYIKRTYGSERRIILSEQGYTSRKAGKDVSTVQAAAIAYSYLLTESNDMVDSFIMNRHVDHDVEVKQGLNLGLWTTDSSSASPEWANTKKTSYEVFQYMDTDRSPEVTSFALKTIGISSWNELIKNYSPALYTKRTAAIGTITDAGTYHASRSLSSGWSKYGASSSAKTISGGLSLKHDASRNRNAPWGAVRKGNLDLSACSRFYATVTVSGASSGNARLKMCFYSGKNTLEATKTIRTGTAQTVSLDLSSWAYRHQITKIRITLQPQGKGTWKSGASLRLTHAAAS